MNSARLCLLDGMESVLSHKEQERQEWSVGWVVSHKEQERQEWRVGWVVCHKGQE